MSTDFKDAKTRTLPPFRADHVGSFLRPQSVKEARLKVQEKLIGKDELRAVEDKAITELVAKQKAAGLRSITDGELRRSWWHLDFLGGLDGVEKVTTDKGLAFHGVQTKAESVVLENRIDFSDHFMLRDFKFLQSLITEQAQKDSPGNTAPGHIAKMTIPSPAMLHFVLSVRNDQFTLPSFYANEAAFFSGITLAYQKAVQAFYDAGCRYLQLDDTSWGGLCSAEQRAQMENRGINPDSLAEKYVELINDSIADRPEDMTVTMHICRGNFRSTWFSSGGYEPVAAELFGGCDIDGFFLEYDTERAGDFSPLRHIKDQQVVLGLISSKTGVLEDKALIKQRIAEAARIVPVNQLCLSPQCGFSSTEEGNILTEEEQWTKIRLVVEVAAEVWK